MSANGLDLDVALLVVAKAPIPGLAKTRLAADIGDDGAAEIAAAALLDTLDAVARVPVAYRIVALSGALDVASHPEQLADALAGSTVIGQRGDGLAERLVSAHADAAEITGLPVLQIGMDTPQVTASDLTGAARMLAERTRPSVLGPAADGGWWALGVPDFSIASCLATVAMSRPDTGLATYRALSAAGAHIRLLPTLRDVDFVHDLAPVARVCPAHSHFREAVADLRRPG